MALNGSILKYKSNNNTISIKIREIINQKLEEIIMFEGNYYLITI